MVYKEKCKTCPYHLGFIKCIVSPCKECLFLNLKCNPFENKDKKKLDDKNETHKGV